MTLYEITLKEYNSKSTTVIYRSVKSNERAAASQLIKFMDEKFPAPGDQ
jgi:hypothetical protein